MPKHQQNQQNKTKQMKKINEWIFFSPSIL